MTNSNVEDVYPTIDCCISKGCSGQMDSGGGYVLMFMREDGDLFKKGV